ncbi:MAG: hypothetical protein HS108_07590 [Planctomycetes bacterium]|nr:hypothetical protein [Planctomycetota bacterium]MCL4729458.1 hypothetical protein [Planctomycetota bacterium]
MLRVQSVKVSPGAKDTRAEKHDPTDDSAHKGSKAAPQAGLKAGIGRRQQRAEEKAGTRSRQRQKLHVEKLLAREISVMFMGYSLQHSNTRTLEARLLWGMSLNKGGRLLYQP